MEGRSFCNSSQSKAAALMAFRSPARDLLQVCLIIVRRFEQADFTLLHQHPRLPIPVAVFIGFFRRDD